MCAVAVRQEGEAATEPRRARYPDESGYVERDGVRSYYEVYGTGELTVMLLPVWTIFHSRIWKAQIPYLARHYRVITFDGRGGGRSDRPSSPAGYAIEEVARDALAVMDATDTEDAALVGASRAAQWGLWLATERRERVRGLALCCPSFPASARSLHIRLLLNPRVGRALIRPLPAYPGWLRFNPYYMAQDYEGFLRWFVGRVNNVPHSTRIIESMTAYAMESNGQVAFASVSSPQMRTRRELLARARAVSCPTLVMCGTRDRITPFADARALARATGGELVAIRGGGHAINTRNPTVVNTALRRFLDRSEVAP